MVLLESEFKTGFESIFFKKEKKVMDNATSIYAQKVPFFINLELT